jgi:hypothetical protein
MDFRRRSSRNMVEYMGGAFPDFFKEFIDTHQQRMLAEVSRRCTNAFGATPLDDDAYGILKNIQDQGWTIKIKAKDGFPTHLYMCSQNDPLVGKQPERVIPNEVCLLTTLKELVIRCKFRSRILGGLPEHIGNLVNLEFLDARRTYITTKFPDSMVNMCNLRSLNLEGLNVIKNIPSSWLCRRNGPEEKAARVIQNAWRGKDLQEGANTEYFGEIPGPLRFSDSRVNIWERAGYRGYPRNYVGSILDMPKHELVTPYMWMVDSRIPEGGVWLRKPILMRSMGMRSVKMWYGDDYM